MADTPHRNRNCVLSKSTSTCICQLSWRCCGHHPKQPQLNVLTGYYFTHHLERGTTRCRQIPYWPPILDFLPDIVWYTSSFVRTVGTVPIFSVVQCSESARYSISRFYLAYLAQPGLSSPGPDVAILRHRGHCCMSRMGNRAALDRTIRFLCIYFAAQWPQIQRGCSSLLHLHALQHATTLGPCHLIQLACILLLDQDRDAATRAHSLAEHSAKPAEFPVLQKQRTF